MLEYGLPEAPEGYRWYLRRSSVSPEYVYLHLERVKRNFVGYRSTLHKTMVSKYTIENKGYEAAVREAARSTLRDVNVNFNLPTGEVR